MDWECAFILSSCERGELYTESTQPPFFLSRSYYVVTLMVTSLVVAMLYE